MHFYISECGFAWLALWPFMCLFLSYHCPDLEECLVPLLLLYLTLCLLLLGLLYLNGTPVLTCLSKCHKVYMKVQGQPLPSPSTLVEIVSCLSLCTVDQMPISLQGFSPVSNPALELLGYRHTLERFWGFKLKFSYIHSMCFYVISLAFPFLLFNIPFLSLCLSIGYIFEFQLSFSCSEIC